MWHVDRWSFALLLKVLFYQIKPFRIDFTAWFIHVRYSNMLVSDT